VTHRVEIIGGGPAGAFTARLLARRHPGWRVRLFERLPPDDTFGFGVGLTHGLVRSLKRADPEVAERLQAASHPFASMRFEVPRGIIRFGQSHSGAIRRARLLRVLLDSAEEAGAEVVIGRSAAVGEIAGDADLIVGADGLSSEVRAEYAAAFGPATKSGRGAFIWCAAEVELDGTVFIPAETEHGTFVAHSYPYDRGVSTFVIEASQRTVERAGFIGRAWASGGESDEAALEYLSRAFRPLLQGARFRGNRSRWTHFTTLTCRQWHTGNVVLLGDAAATVHPSLGSGTKVALESAIALAEAIDAVGDGPLAAALPVFERNRRPSVERLQDSATRSQLWWESFTARGDIAPARLAVAYLTRAGVVSLADVAATMPDLARQACADYAGVTLGEVPADDIIGWVLDRPIEAGGVRFPRRLLTGTPHPGEAARVEVTFHDAWGEEGDGYLEQAREHVRAGRRLIWLDGGKSRLAVLDRLTIAERLRMELPVCVGVTVHRSHVDLAAAGLVAGRTDLAWLHD
jgi:anthraniloyl-CoA monooxygenase